MTNPTDHDDDAFGTDDDIDNVEDDGAEATAPAQRKGLADKLVTIAPREVLKKPKRPMNIAKSPECGRRAPLLPVPSASTSRRRFGWIQTSPSLCPRSTATR